MANALDVSPRANLDMIEIVEQSAGEHRRLSFRGCQAPCRRQAPVEWVTRRQKIERFRCVAGLAGMLVTLTENAYEAWIGLQPPDRLRW